LIRLDFSLVEVEAFRSIPEYGTAEALVEEDSHTRMKFSRINAQALESKSGVDKFLSPNVSMRRAIHIV
jgi:hypothetical protein